MSKYDRTIIDYQGITLVVDAYNVIIEFAVTCPAILLAEREATE